MQTLYSKVLLWTEIPILVYTDIDVVAIFVVVVVAAVVVVVLLLLCLFVVFSPALRSQNGIAKSSYSIILKFLVLVQQ